MMGSMMVKRVRQPLTAKRVAALSTPGMYCDGGNLYLKVSGEGGKSWIFRAVVQGKRRDYGLGSADFVSLKEARDKAFEMRRVAREGGDPRPKEPSKELTFSEAAKRAYETQKVKWTSGKHAEAWWAMLEHHVLPVFGNRQLGEISTREVYELLQPIYQSKPATGRRVRQRIGVVFDWAKAADYFHKENPTAGLKTALPVAKTTGEHHAAMPWTELPDFMVELHGRSGPTARLTEFTILTCLRSSEARSIEWDFIQGDTLAVPKHLMKSRLAHRVPLSRQCQKVLNMLPQDDPTLVFPGSISRKTGERTILSVNAYRALYKRMGLDGFTTHGFRSTFRSWCQENDVADWETCEAALAHVVGNSVERAYARSDLFEKRRKLMQAWADFAMAKVWPRPPRKKLAKHRRDGAAFG